MSTKIGRPFILHLLKNCNEAKAGLAMWKNGDATWEEAMMTIVKDLVISNEEMQRRLSYAPCGGIFNIPLPLA
jgi:hypothetical protein